MSLKTVQYAATGGEKDKMWSSGLNGVDLTKGGQWGFLPIIGGLDDQKKPIHEYMYNSSYLKQDVIPIVLQTPLFFKKLPNGNDGRYDLAVKALFEVHAKSIDGLNSSLTVSTVEEDTGLSGAKFKQPNGTTRADTSITVNLGNERYGLPFETLLDVWIRYGMYDPETKGPLVSKYLDENVKVYGPEWWTCTVLFIEPDVLFKNVVHAWLVSNLFPTSNPDITGKKSESPTKEQRSLSIEFGGLAIPTTNIGVIDLANKVLKSLKLYERTPDEIKLPVNEIQADLKKEPYYSPMTDK